eukprot:scaffold28459_cov17-Tisochrysis_lutea.AAC.1
MDSVGARQSCASRRTVLCMMHRHHVPCMIHRRHVLCMLHTCIGAHTGAPRGRCHGFFATHEARKDAKPLCAA